MRAPVVLHAISSFDDAVLDRTASTITQGLAGIISADSPLRNEVTKSPDFWSTLQRLHQHKTEAEPVFNILTLLASTSTPTAVTADNFESAVSLANDFASAGSIGSIQEKRRDFAAKRGHQAKPARPEDIVVVQRATKAVGLIYTLSDRVPFLIDQSHLERQEAWAAYWSPVFRALCAQCVNPCREVRHRALSALQRTLLSEAVADKEMGHNHTEWTAIFDEVIFPLTLRLLKPEIYQLDPAGMNDTRAHMASLLCKIYLRYLDRLVEVPAVVQPEADPEEQDEDNAPASTTAQQKEKQSIPLGQSKMVDVWVKTLELLDRLMNAGTVVENASDALAEAVLEGVKNTLLVMHGAGFLDHRSMEKQDGNAEDKNKQATKGPREKSKETQIWPDTVRRLDRFLPGLISELFPDAPPVSVSVPVSPVDVGGGSRVDNDPAHSPNTRGGNVGAQERDSVGSRPGTRDG